MRNKEPQEYYYGNQAIRASRLSHGTITTARLEPGPPDMAQFCSGARFCSGT